MNHQEHFVFIIYQVNQFIKIATKQKNPQLIVNMDIHRLNFIFYALLAFLLWNIAFNCACYGSRDELYPPKMIRNNGYPAEVHKIYSKDNQHISELHRIPYGKAVPNIFKIIFKTPVLLHHGLFSSSTDWIINGPEKSLAYRLADEGYDVWMANARGNEYARMEYVPYRSRGDNWDFSLHEIGTKDLPAAIDYILEETKHDKLIYIGHSLGTTCFYIMASKLPEYNEKVKFQISLAPIAALGHTKSAFRLLIPFIYLKQIEEKTGLLSNSSTTLRSLIRWIYCPDTYFNDINACAENLIYQIFGSDPEQLDKSMIPTIIKYVFSGTSYKTVIHFGQLIRRGVFSPPEYTQRERSSRFGPLGPPSEYYLFNITTPIRVYYGENDALADSQDVQILYEKFSTKLGLVKIEYEKWNHVDFVWAKEINQFLNDHIVKFINKATDPLHGDDFIAETIRSNTPSS